MSALTSDQKIDRIMQLLEGDGSSAPGVIARLHYVETDMYGEGHNLGIKTKVTIIWRFWIWMLCTASALAGFGLRSLMNHLP